MARQCVLITTAFLVASLATTTHSTAPHDRVMVTTEDGQIAGVITSTVKGRDFYSYWSIPYAQPPVGELRLRDPVVGLGWEGVRDGGEMPPMCSQIPWFNVTSRNFAHEGTEDCLFLNIFTHTPNEKEANLPVLAFIHGGGFFSLGSDIFTPYIIMEQDLVYVSIQYRVGIMGFLSTEDSVIPGNFGLKDQTMALRWLQKNIVHFGGDPDRVTIFGESAGGASVHFHYLSPYSEGLFARGIMHSGTALCPWANGAAYKEVAEFTGRLFGCPEPRAGVSSREASNVLLQCLQMVDAEELSLALQHHFTFNYNPALVVPRVDGDFLPAAPEVLLSQGRHNKASLISGINLHEGALFTLPMYAEGHEFMREAIKENFAEIGPESLDLRREDEDSQGLATKIFEHYAGGVTEVDDAADQLCELYGDRHFNLPHEWTGQLHARNTAVSDVRVYLYNLTHRGQLSLRDLYNINVGEHWVSHVDDMFYLYSGGFMRTLERQEDLKLRYVMLQMWYNFAATGDPTPDHSLGFKWEPATEHNLQHLNLQPQPVMQADTRKQVRAFWETLPLKENKILNPDKIIRSSEPNPKKQQGPPPKPRKHRHTEL